MSQKSDYKKELSNVAHQLPQVPTLFLLDTSGSMGKNAGSSGNSRIEELQEGINRFADEINDHFEASEGVTASIITFGGDVTVEQDFTPFKQWNPPNLPEPSGTTPMCEAIMRGINNLEEFKDAVDDEDLDRKRAHIWLLTDGEPDNTSGNKKWEKAQNTIQKAVDGKHIMMFAGAVGKEANKKRLEDLLEPAEKSAAAFELKPGQFKEFFEIASNSIEAESEGADSGTDEPDAEEELSDAKN